MRAAIRSATRHQARWDHSHTRLSGGTGQNRLLSDVGKPRAGQTSGVPGRDCGRWSFEVRNWRPGRNGLVGLPPRCGNRPACTSARSPMPDLETMDEDQAVTGSPTSIHPINLQSVRRTLCPKGFTSGLDVCVSFACQLPLHSQSASRSASNHQILYCNYDPDATLAPVKPHVHSDHLHKRFAVGRRPCLRVRESGQKTVRKQ